MDTFNVDASVRRRRSIMSMHAPRIVLSSDGDLDLNPSLTNEIGLCYKGFSVLERYQAAVMDDVAS
jgi:hypothetical protein